MKSTHYTKPWPYTQEQLKAAFEKENCISDVLRSLGLAVGGNHVILKRRAASIGLDVAGMIEKGKRHVGKKPSIERLPLNHFLVKGKYVQSHQLKLRLIEEGIFEHRCQDCGLSTWKENPIPLELHHKNGNSLDNELTNIELLCPNCHTFTENYRGRKRRTAAYYEREEKKNRLARGEKITKKVGIRPTKIKWPTDEVLQSMLWSCPAVEIAKKLGITDTALGKHAKKRGITKPAHGYWLKGKSPIIVNKYYPPTKIDHITPEELQRMLRTNSVRKLASTLGVGEKILAGKVKRYNIEIQSRGYWASKEAKSSQSR